MTFSIGRVGYSAPTLNMPTSVQFNADQTKLAGITRSTSAAQAIVLRDQLRGLANNVDEPVVPITFDSTYASYTGMYRIDGVSSDMQAGDGANWIVRWSVDATRVGSYQQAFSESRCVVACLTNAHGITTANAAGEFGAPGSAASTSPTEFTPNNATYFDAQSVFDGADGTVFIAGLKTSVYTGLTVPAVVRYTVPLTRWYIGGVRVQMAGDYVIGRQAVDSPTSWTIENSLVKVSASATAGAFDVSHWDGSQWDTAKVFAVFGPVAGTINGFNHVGILRNGIEAVTIRLGLSNPGGYSSFADVTVKRGSRWVQVSVSSDIGENWGIKRTAVEAATGITGGIRATANDASGNRYVLSTPVAFTSDLVNGSLRATSSANRVFLGIGSEVGGSGASSPFTAQVQVYRFIGQAFETNRVVGR